MNWRPDWHDASAYPDRRTDKQWRWEFLRRDENYQADFEKHQPDYLAAKIEEYRNTPLPDGVESWEIYFRPLAEMPGCDEKYGVSILLDPAESEPFLGLFVAECPYGVNYASERTLRDFKRDSIKLVAFDLKAPLKPQLERAERYLDAIQDTIQGGKPREQRKHRSKWARYLRVLDAKAAGAKSREIARHLELGPTANAEGFDPERLVSETYEQARVVQLRFSGDD